MCFGCDKRYRRCLYISMDGQNMGLTVYNNRPQKGGTYSLCSVECTGYVADVAIVKDD